MARALTERSDGRIAFVIQQIGLLSIVLLAPASIGLWRLISSPGFARWRPIGVAFVVLFVTFLALEGKAYYVAPLYPVLLAAGACWFEAKRGARQNRVGCCRRSWHRRRHCDCAPHRSSNFSFDRGRNRRAGGNRRVARARGSGRGRIPFDSRRSRGEVVTLHRVVWTGRRHRSSRRRAGASGSGERPQQLLAMGSTR